MSFETIALGNLIRKATSLLSYPKHPIHNPFCDEVVFVILRVDEPLLVK